MYLSASREQCIIPVRFIAKQAPYRKCVDESARRRHNANLPALWQKGDLLLYDGVEENFLIHFFRLVSYLCKKE
jgi:hypothetical protein